MKPTSDPSPAQNTAENRPKLTHLGVLLATWFGAGYLPKAPGTWGSLAALPCAWVIMVYGGILALACATLVVFMVGIWASRSYMKKTGSHDPGAIVIDEVAGQWMTLLAAPPEIEYYLVGFILFRTADIFKPWPANWADKKVGGGFGVMLDDIVAALYSCGLLFAVYKLQLI